MKKTLTLAILTLALIIIAGIWFKKQLSQPTEKELLQKIYQEVSNGNNG